MWIDLSKGLHNDFKQKVGTGEYTTGYVGGGQSGSDKKIGSLPSQCSISVGEER